MSAPPDRRDLWFEDFSPGQRFRTRGMTLTETMILDFAREWDPQPFHLDREAAAASPYGGLIASGWQSLVVAFRLVLDERILSVASIGSPGVDALRWLKPVRPGDTLRAAGEIVDVRPSRSKADRGFVIADYATTNQEDEVVMTFRVTHILRRRPR